MVKCDPSENEESRNNALAIGANVLTVASDTTKSKVVDQHNEYRAQGKEDRHRASQVFFEKTGNFGLLNDTERHAIVSSACKQLSDVHLAFNNFYNEPPFAQRLRDISGAAAIPDSTKLIYVQTVAMCAIGNAYGISDAAYPFYLEMVKNFSPKEVEMMFGLLSDRNIVSERVRSHRRCNLSFQELAKLINPASVTTRIKPDYERWING